jgi:hypothetical protein
MKIQLERKLKDRSHQLGCVACQQSFSNQRLRTLLCHDDGSIVGDICTSCIEQGASQIQQRLRVRSIELFQQPLTEDSSLSSYRQALELSELATQPLLIPPFYAWWWQQLTIFAAETQALEIARREPINCRHRQSKPLKITFLTDEPSVGKDN